jgi:lipopolysaccharide export system permease protein
VLIQTFSGNRLKEITTARTFFWKDSLWLGTEVVIKEFGNFDVDPDPIKTASSPTYTFEDYKEKPSYFEDWLLRRDAFSMDYFKLRTFIQVSRQLGKDVTKQVVDLENKIAFPLINVIIILIGVSLASSPRRSGLAISFGVSMWISFIFYTCVKVALEFGHEGELPPLIAAWGTNAVFFLIGVVLLIRTRK